MRQSSLKTLILGQCFNAKRNFFLQTNRFATLPHQILFKNWIYTSVVEEGKELVKNSSVVPWISFISGVFVFQQLLFWTEVYVYINLISMLFSKQSLIYEQKSSYTYSVFTIPCATVDMTTDGVDDTTAVTAIVLAVQEGVEQLLLLVLLLTKEDWEAVITTGCFWVVEAMTDVGTSFVTAA